MKDTYLLAILCRILRYPSLLAFVLRQIKIVKASKIHRFRLDRIGKENPNDSENNTLLLVK